MMLYEQIMKREREAEGGELRQLLEVVNFVGRRQRAKHSWNGSQRK